MSKWNSGSFGESFGYVFPKHGVIVFYQSELERLCNFTVDNSYDTDAYNQEKFFEFLKHSIEIGIGDIEERSFISRSIECSEVQDFHIRLKNKAYNYSNNPTFYNAENGDIRPEMVEFPETLPTTIGLYNNRWELLAVAKVSRVTRKNFWEEDYIKVKLKQR